MIARKTREEIEVMSQGGAILAQTLRRTIEAIAPGVSELDLDRLAQEYILEKGAQPGFKRVKGYHHAICVSTNDVVVHGIPTTYAFQEGDVVGVDCGVYYKGFHTDMAETRRVSTKNPFDGFDPFGKLRAGKLTAGGLRVHPEGSPRGAGKEQKG